MANLECLSRPRLGSLLAVLGFIAFCLGSIATFLYLRIRYKFVPKKKEPSVENAPQLVAAASGKLLPLASNNAIRSWTKGRIIGRGTFGTVYEAMTDKGFFFAVKEVLLPEGDHNNEHAKQMVMKLEQEIKLLSSLSHDNIVHYFGMDKGNGTLQVFLELVSQGSILSLYRKYKLTESQVSSYTKQILNGLHYLHEQNVVHRDIKCANLLIDTSGCVKLADFGLAKELSSVSKAASVTGTVNWMAPEMVKAKPCGLPADVWSLGCTILEMLTGQYPYSGVEWVAAMFKIGKGILPEIPSTLSEDARDFLARCLKQKPEERATVAQLMEHPFVQTSDLGCS